MSEQVVNIDPNASNIIYMTAEEAAKFRVEAPLAVGIVLYKETIHAMYRFIHDYPQCAGNMTLNINMFIMQSIENARRSLTPTPTNRI